MATHPQTIADLNFFQLFEKKGFVVSFKGYDGFSHAAKRYFLDICNSHINLVGRTPDKLDARPFYYFRVFLQLPEGHLLS